jgi:hypothetical protein
MASGNSSATSVISIRDYRHDTTFNTTSHDLNDLDLRVIRAALSLVEAKVIVGVRAKVGGLVFAVFALVRIAFVIKGVFAVAKELFVAERIEESFDTFSSMVALVIPGAGLEDNIAQDTRPSVRTVAVHVTDILVRVRVKVRTVVLLRVIHERGGTKNAGIVSAVQVTCCAVCLGLDLWNNAAAQGSDGSSEEKQGVVAHHR